MASAIVQPGQTLEDIAVQWLGSAEGAYELARLNGIGFTSSLLAGQELELPEVRDKRIRRAYDLRGYRPATEGGDPGDLVNSAIVIEVNADYRREGVIIVQPGQSLQDIAVQWLGSAEAVYELAGLNGLTYTATLQAGQELELPAAYSKRTAAQFARNGWAPATETSSGDYDPEGIGYWYIEIDFKSS
jgi:hypothetical protein